jgi:hypothetical protein
MWELAVRDRGGRGARAGRTGRRAQPHLLSRARSGVVLCPGPLRLRRAALGAGAGSLRVFDAGLAPAARRGGRTLRAYRARLDRGPAAGPRVSSRAGCGSRRSRPERPRARGARNAPAGRQALSVRRSRRCSTSSAAAWISARCAISAICSAATARRAGVWRRGSGTRPTGSGPIRVLASGISPACDDLERDWTGRAPSMAMPRRVAALSGACLAFPFPAGRGTSSGVLEEILWMPM